MTLALALALIGSWVPTAKAHAAGAPVEADISRLKNGEQMTVEWRGKPVWIIRRPKEILIELHKNPSYLRDPHSDTDQQPEHSKNPHRSANPEYLILVGICTHLGCSPTYRPDIGGLGPKWPGGFFCPCHGSKFDLAGRVYEGMPAPINLEVPPYRFLNDKLVLIGENPIEAIEA